MRRFDETESTTSGANSAPPQHAPAGLPPGLMPLLLTEAQAAELLAISARKVWELAAAGVIPCIKIGTVKRYRRIDLEEWVGRGCPTS